MSRYTYFTKLKHLIFPNRGSRRVTNEQCWIKQLAVFTLAGLAYSGIRARAWSDETRKMCTAPQSWPTARPPVDMTPSCTVPLMIFLLYMHGGFAHVFHKGQRSCGAPCAEWYLTRILGRGTRFNPGLSTPSISPYVYPVDKVYDQSVTESCRFSTPRFWPA
jgi:hypothetical protein